MGVVEILLFVLFIEVKQKAAWVLSRTLRREALAAEQPLPAFDRGDVEHTDGYDTEKPEGRQRDGIKYRL